MMSRRYTTDKEPHDAKQQLALLMYGLLRKTITKKKKHIKVKQRNILIHK